MRWIGAVVFMAQPDLPGYADHHGNQGLCPARCCADVLSAPGCAESHRWGFTPSLAVSVPRAWAVVAFCCARSVPARTVSRHSMRNGLQTEQLQLLRRCRNHG